MIQLKCLGWCDFCNIVCNHDLQLCQFSLSDNPLSFKISYDFAFTSVIFFGKVDSF